MIRKLEEHSPWIYKTESGGYLYSATSWLDKCSFNNIPETGALKSTANEYTKHDQVVIHIQPLRGLINTALITGRKKAFWKVLPMSKWCRIKKPLLIPNGHLTYIISAKVTEGHSNEPSQVYMMKSSLILREIIGSKKLLIFIVGVAMKRMENAE